MYDDTYIFGSHISIHAKGGKRHTSWHPFQKRPIVPKCLWPSQIPGSFPPRCYWTTHDHLTKPQEAQAAGAGISQAAAAAPETSPANLTSCSSNQAYIRPIQGLAHHFQSLELHRPRISKKPSVTKPSLLQLHHGLCHRQWLHKEEPIIAFWNQNFGVLMGDLGEYSHPPVHADTLQSQGSLNQTSWNKHFHAFCLVALTIVDVRKMQKKIHSTF